MYYVNTLAKTIKLLIQKKYGTINKFSEASKIPYMTISCIIKRGVNTATVGTLTKICQALDMTVPDLYLKRAYDSINYWTRHCAVEDYPDETLIKDLKESNIININKSFYDDEKLNEIILSFRDKLIED